MVTVATARSETLLNYLRVPLLLEGQPDVEETSGLQLHAQLLAAGG